MKTWVRILPGDNNYNDYAQGVPSWKITITQILDMAFRFFMVVCILSMVAIFATGHWIGGLAFFLSGLISAFSLWFRQLFYFHIKDRYKTMDKWYYDRREAK